MERVLLVDDHRHVRRVLREYLCLCHEVIVVGEAAGGAEAVQLTGELLPDVVLMDIAMPGMSGVEATTLIRRSYPEVRVITISSYPQPEVRDSALEAGAADHLLKPVTLRELQDALDRSRK